MLKLFHDPRPGAQVRIALAPCSPFSVNKRLMSESAALAERYDCQLHTHLCETEDEERFCLEVYGVRPVDLLEETGWMSKRTWLAHGIHFNAEEIGRLGKAGVGVCHCAASNMVLASGICRTCELEQAGAPVGIGVDGSASNDASNMMEAVRHALMIGRLRYGAGAVTHLDVLRWASEGSARCLGREDIGKIEVGRQADLALFTLDEPRFSGAHDPLAALVLCGAHRADRVMIGGRWRVIDGAPAEIRSPADACRLRLALVTEDRKARGLHLAPAGVHPRHAHRREGDRHGQGLAQGRDRHVEGGHVAHHPLAERDRFQVGDVPLERHLRIGAAIDVFEEDPREPASRELPIVRDRSRAQMPLPFRFAKLDPDARLRARLRTPGAEARS